ncbi:MAG: acetate--CoA ligase family protein [Nitrospira sp.]|nr:acetate--CoA ligase family protein [Nitrospira sp.]
MRDACESIRTGLTHTNTLDAVEGVLVQPMLSGSVLVMVGMTRDPLFGPLIAFGLWRSMWKSLAMFYFAWCR